MGFIAVLIIAIVIGALFWCFYDGNEEGAKGALADMNGFMKVIFRLFSFLFG